MGTGETKGRRSLLMWIGVAAVALVAAGIVIALNLRNDQQVANPSVEPSPSPTAPTTSPTTEAPEPTPSESETPELTAETPYCEAFRTIIAGGAETESEAGEVENLKALSKKYAEYLKKYRQAAKLAPDELKDEYETVIAFLKDAKEAVDSGDFDRIRATFKSLSTLNDTMAAIDEESRRICA